MAGGVKVSWLTDLHLHPSVVSEDQFHFTAAKNSLDPCIATSLYLLHHRIAALYKEVHPQQVKETVNSGLLKGLWVV